MPRAAVLIIEGNQFSAEIKKLDRKIVLNSVILKWDVVKKEFRERVKF